MKFCYLDESGTGNEPIAVMAGIITDASRMRVTKQQWSELLQELSKIVGKDIPEIHTRDLYSGNSPWRNLNGQQRSDIISTIFNALEKRKHHIVYTAVNKELFFQEFPKDDRYNDVSTLWRFMALHITLSLQKRYQSESRNKGNTILIFDNEEKEKTRFTDLIINCPDWTDTYYAKKQKQEKLDQIVDVPHFVDSHFLCFFLRKHIELQHGYCEPTYEDEKERVANWINIALNRSIPKSNIFLSKGRCNASELFFRFAPKVIL